MTRVLVKQRRPRGGGPLHPADINLQPPEQLLRPPTGLIVADLRHQGGAGAASGGVGGEPGCGAAQDPVHAPGGLLEAEVADRKPVQDPEHRGHDS